MAPGSATSGPRAIHGTTRLRKAFGWQAGVMALLIALAVSGGLFLLPLLGWLRGTFPVMMVLGPFLVVQHLVWMRVQGSERTTAHYLAAEPPPSPRVVAAR